MLHEFTCLCAEVENADVAVFQRAGNLRKAIMRLNFQNWALSKFLFPFDFSSQVIEKRKRSIAVAYDKVILLGI